jgi:hypothetical protein
MTFYCSVECMPLEISTMIYFITSGLLIIISASNWIILEKQYDSRDFVMHVHRRSVSLSYVN